MDYWFRWYEGSTEDTKFRVIARNANVTVATVMGVWAALLEDASRGDPRGVSVRDGDHYTIILGLSADELKSILQEMEGEGLIQITNSGITVTKWKERQFETDKVDRTNAERQQRWRAKQKLYNDQTDSNASVTPDKLPEPEPEPDKSNNKNLTSLTGRAKRASRACRLPADAVPSDRNVADAQMVGLTPAEIDQQWQRMRDWSASSPKGACLNWDARWRNWVGTFLTSKTTTNGHSPFPETEGQRDRRKHREVIDALRRSVEDDLREAGSDPDTGLLPIKPRWQ